MKGGNEMSIDLNRMPKLGFGLMRLPKKGLSIDIDQTAQMVDMFMDAGFNYFDTAHVYLGSEEATRKALVERKNRESYTVATKLYVPLALTEKSAKKQFDTSLERMGLKYIDYYLLHTLKQSNYKKYEKFHLWRRSRNWPGSLKKRGRYVTMDFPIMMDHSFWTGF